MNVMSREQSPARKEAFKIWVDSGRKKKPKEIADELGLSGELIRKWKCIDKWEQKPDPRPGAPKGNQNAKGNKGGNGGPLGNDNAVKHGLFRKFLPDDPDTQEIFDASDDISPMDLLWTSIRILWTNIVRSQRIMFVRDQQDQTKVLKKVSESEQGEMKEWEYQHAWDKQGAALSAQSAAMRTLGSKIKQYEEMLRASPPESVMEEHRLRMEKLKAEVKAIQEKGW